MKRMKTFGKIFNFQSLLPVFLILTVFSSSAFIYSDKDASQILEKVSKNYKSYKTIKAAF
jgi:hypothetical protein